MQRYERSIVIAAPRERLFAFHEETENLLRISPPNAGMEVLAVEGASQLGRRVHLRMTQLGIFSTTMIIEFIEYDPPRRMVDVQRKGPFRSWRQERIFEEVEGGTRLTDSVIFEAPLGVLGRLAERLLIAPRIRAMFTYRQERTKELIETEERGA